MRRNCNLELALFPLSHSGAQETSDISPLQNYLHHGRRRHHHHHQEEQSQPLTIFYEGKVCVADVTEHQAKSILTLANKKMEERVRTPTGSEPCSPTVMQSHNQLHSPDPALSMRKSLQRFLQKRRIRVQAEASPY